MRDPEEIVQELFADPDFVEARRRHKAVPAAGRPVGSWEASTHYADLNAALDAALDDPNSSCYELGIDGFQVNQVVPRSAQAAFLRCADLPPDLLSKKRWARLIMLVPGKPMRWDAYFECLGTQLARLSFEGVKVVAATRRQDGKVVKEASSLHRGYLSAVFADAPMRADVMYYLVSALRGWVGARARLFASPRCHTRGSTLDLL